jgi:hypothetical protein
MQLILRRDEGPQSAGRGWWSVFGLAFALGMGACAGSDEDKSGTPIGGGGAGSTSLGNSGSSGGGAGGTRPPTAGTNVGTAGSTPPPGGSGGRGGSAAGMGGGGASGGSAAAGAGSGGATAGSGGASGAAGSDPGGSTFPPVTDFEADGPFPAMRVVEGPSCAFYHPATMGEAGRKHPVIVWGNGTGGSNTSYQEAHLHFATHGFIVAAANTANSGSGTEMIACLDWLSDENDKAGGKYGGKVDMTKIASSGHSQGGCATLMAGRDERVIATAPVQPYILIPLGGCSYSSAIGMQHGPMFLMSGSADTIATPGANQTPIFGDAEVPVFWGTRQGADHLGAATSEMSGYRGAMTAWFRFQLMGDLEAKKMFSGADCTLCKDTNWQIMKKMFE